MVTVFTLFLDGIDFASTPVITSKTTHPYAFSGQNFSLSCVVEKAQSSHVFLKWTLLNQTCYEVSPYALADIQFELTLSKKSTGDSMIVEEVETVSQRGKGKPNVGSGNRQNRDLVRLNLTLTNVDSQLDGATLQCAISDASLAQKTAQFKLQVFGKILNYNKTEFSLICLQRSRNFYSAHSLPRRKCCAAIDSFTLS